MPSKSEIDSRRDLSAPRSNKIGIESGGRFPIARAKKRLCYYGTRTSASAFEFVVQILCVAFPATNELERLFIYRFADLHIVPTRSRRAEGKSRSSRAPDVTIWNPSPIEAPAQCSIGQLSARLALQ